MIDEAGPQCEPATNRRIRQIDTATLDHAMQDRFILNSAVEAFSGG